MPEHRTNLLPEPEREEVRYRVISVDDQSLLADRLGPGGADAIAFGNAATLFRHASLAGDLS